MKSSNHIISIVLCLLTSIINSNYCSSQTNTFSDVHSSIKKFYEYLFNKSNITDSEFSKICSRFDNPSYHTTDTSWIFYEIKNQYFQELTQNTDFKTITSIINNLKTHDDGDIGGQYAILTFPNNKKVYFGLNADSIVGEFPAQIGDIYLNDGRSLFDLLDNCDSVMLMWVGIINSEKNRTSINLYRKPDFGAISNKKIVVDQIFFFTPIGDSEWYPIYSSENCKRIGFLRKSQVVTFDNFPNKVKNLILDSYQHN